MENTVYTITLSDDSTLTNLTLNGTNFVSSAYVDEDTFTDKLSYVVISGDDGSTEEYTNLELVRCCLEYDGNYWFAFRQLSDEELTSMKIQSDLEYIAMMADIEL